MVRRLARTLALAAAIAVVAAIVVRALITRRRPPVEPAATWPPLTTAGERDVPREPTDATPDRGSGTATDADEAERPDAGASTAGSAPTGDRAWVEPADGTCPASHPLKAKLASGIFHAPGGLSYDRTKPDRCYADADAAEADGLRPSKR